MAGHRDDVKNHAKWLLYLIILSGVLAFNVIRIKKNYTDVHRRLSEAEYNIERYHGTQD